MKINEDIKRTCPFCKEIDSMFWIEDEKCFNCDNCGTDIYEDYKKED